MKRTIKPITVFVFLVYFVWGYSQSNEYDLPESVEDGVMFHAHRWQFTDIKNNLQTFAEAGYNSIQVSPVTRVKTGAENEWWGLYQPCNLEIGNPLGTYSEFVDLCTTAESYGIKIIVDAVLNHLADENGICGSVSSEVDQNILDNAWKWLRFNGCNGSDGSAYQDRWRLTQCSLSTLPEWNTQHSKVQALHVQFLNTCISAGADGFRFDAAKHIETNIYEDAGQSWAGDYWDNVLGSLNNSSSLYLFGEVLPDYADNEEAYMQYFDITAHGYGSTLRSAVDNKFVGNLLVINHHNGTIPKEKALCYVENHDDYHNGVSTSMSYESRKLAYALLIPRAGLTPRVFGRPFEDLYKDDDIVAVNKFRNAMNGQEEYLRFPSNEVLIIERGTKGMVIVNVGDYGQNISSPTYVSDGTYENAASYSTFVTVSGGNFSTYVPSRTIIVIGNYSQEENEDTWYFSGDINNWSATEMTWAGGTTYVYTNYFEQGNGFKIRHSADSWDECYPENNWIIWEGSSDYTITFYSDTKYIDVAKTSTKSANLSEKSKSDEIELWPNPVLGNNISIKSGKFEGQTVHIKIFSALGELIESFDAQCLPEILIKLPDNLNNGTYIIQLESNRATLNKYFIKVE